MRIEHDLEFDHIIPVSKGGARVDEAIEFRLVS